MFKEKKHWDGVFTNVLIKFSVSDNLFIDFDLNDLEIDLDIYS